MKAYDTEALEYCMNLDYQFLRSMAYMRDLFDSVGVLDTVLNEVINDIKFE